MRNFISSSIGKTVSQLSRLRGGHGSALPGLVIDKFDHKFLERSLSQLPFGVAIISGTNGKTTTTKMVVELLRANGLRVLTNDSGSNFARGVASSVAQKMRRGRLEFDIAILELDEAHAVNFVREIKPNYSLLLNVLRDQLDRFGEIDTTAKMLNEIAKNTTREIVLNAMDPRIAANAKITPARISWFGFAPKLARLFPTDEQLHDKIDSDNLELRDNKTNEIFLNDFRENFVEYGFNDKRTEVEMSAKGAHNALNGAATLQLVRVILSDNLFAKPEYNNLKKFDFKYDVNLLSRVNPAFGRGENIVLKNKQVVLNLVKNPAGFQSVLSSSKPDLPTLFAINDNYADGRDVSWLYDVDFRNFRENNDLYTTGIRAYDMALRLDYDKVKTLEVNIDISQILADFIDSKYDQIQIFATYTAMLEIRRRLEKIAQRENAND